MKMSLIKMPPKNACLRCLLKNSCISLGVVETADCTGHGDIWAWGDGGPLRSASCWEIVRIPGFNPTPQRLPGIIWPPYRKHAGVA